MFCPSCGSESPEGTKFCIECGQSLAKPEPATPPTPQPSTAQPSYPHSAYFVGSLIVSLIGAILLFTTDFAGWTEGSGDSYYRYSAEYAVGFAEGILPTLLTGWMAGLLLNGAYVSYRGLWPGKTPLSQPMLRRGFYSAVAVFSISILAALVFIVVIESYDDINDWWLDTAFYGGALSGGIAALLFWLALKSEATPQDPTSRP